MLLNHLKTEIIYFAVVTVTEFQKIFPFRDLCYVIIPKVLQNPKCLLQVTKIMF